jgi:streptogramin lyase
MVLLALPVLAMPPKGGPAKAKAKAKRQVQAALLAPAPATLRRPEEAELRPGAVLTRCNLAGRDLSNLDLRGVNLDDSDLGGANLTGADLSLASLQRAQMTGASLKDAWLVQADFKDATGANLAGARLHPFFDTDPDEAKDYSLKFFLLPEAAGRPTRIEMGSTGMLVLQETGTSRGGVLSPHGTNLAFTIPGGSEPTSRILGRDGGGNVWVFGDGNARIFREAELFTRVARGFRDPQYLSGVVATAAGEGETIYASVAPPGKGTMLLALRPKGTTGKLMVEGFLTQGFAFQSMAAMPGLASRMVLGVDPSRDEINTVDPLGRRIGAIELAKGSRPLRLAPGGAGKVWFLAPGNNRVGLVENVGGVPDITREFILPTWGQDDLRLRGLACAPDGTVWITQQSPPALGRIAADSSLTRWPLPDGMVPGEIACGRDGRVYFTLVGRAMLGSFRPAGPLAPPEDPSSSWTVPPPQTSAAMPRLSGKVRRERALNRELPTVEEVEANLEAAAPQPLEEKKTPILVPEGKAEEPATVPEGKAEDPAVISPSARKPEPASAAGSPRDLLESMDLHLGEERITHILRRHSHDSAGAWGQFTAAASTREGLVALLAKGLAQAGEPGRVLKRYDPRGILHTPCWMDAPVGRYQSHGQWKETNCFDVVTLRVRLEDGTAAQVVLSAYPVNPRKY